MSAAKKIILLFWFIVASLASASALTPGATETRVGQKSFAALESRQAEPLQTPGLHQENGRCSYELAPESLLAAKGLDELSATGKMLDSADKGGNLTKAGRALQKHGSDQGKRAASNAFPKPTGNPSQINQQGQNILDDILTSPGSTTKSGNRFGGIDIIAPDGRGARFDANGQFRGFLEP